MIKYFCEVHNHQKHPCPYCKIEVEAAKAGLTTEQYKNRGSIDKAAIAKAKEDMDNCKCSWHLGMGPNLKCPVHGEDKYNPGIEKFDMSEYEFGGQAFGRGLRTKSKEELLAISNIRAMEIQARMFGMVSENNRRTQFGDTPAYSEYDFQLLSEEFNEIIKDI